MKTSALAILGLTLSVSNIDFTAAEKKLLPCSRTQFKDNVYKPLKKGFSQCAYNTGYDFYKATELPTDEEVEIFCSQCKELMDGLWNVDYPNCLVRDGNSTLEEQFTGYARVCEDLKDEGGSKARKKNKKKTDVDELNMDGSGSDLDEESGSTDTSAANSVKLNAVTAAVTGVIIAYFML